MGGIVFDESVVPIMEYKLGIIDRLDPIRKAHQVTDALVEETRNTCGEDIPCKKGCAYCCNQEVVVSIPEAMFVISGLVRTPEGKIWLARNYRKINQHAAIVKELYANNPVKSWEDVRKKHEIWFDKRIPCAFLEKNVCTVYKTRPIICKSYFIRGDASFCDKSSSTPTISVVQIPLATAAAFSASEKVAKDLRIESIPMSLPIAVIWALTGYVYGPGGIRQRMKTGDKIWQVAH